eukprot:COSAG01_NODE_18308_length_1085_cov_3.831081_3_plen_82_part_01
MVGPAALAAGTEMQVAACRRPPPSGNKSRDPAACIAYIPKLESCRDTGLDSGTHRLALPGARLAYVAPQQAIVVACAHGNQS